MDHFPLLSSWEERVVGVHEGAEVGEPGGEVRQGMDAQPGQQEAGADEGLEEDPQVGEPVLPAGVLGPGRMLTRLIGGLAGAGLRQRLRAVAPGPRPTRALAG